MANSDQPTTTTTFLVKHRSWSPDMHRDIEWEKLKIKQRRRYFRHRRSRSVDSISEFDVTDDDIKDLRACFDLGFGFDLSNELDPKLKRAFPALEMYAAVNRQYNKMILSRCSFSIISDTNSSCSSFRSNASARIIVDPSDDPQKMKLRLKRWAQVVACSIREASSQPTTEVAE